MPVIVPLDGRKAVIADVDECLLCFDDIEFGQDYCERCAKAIAAGVQHNQCSSCQSPLTDANISEGYCVCGLPLNNAPPICIGTVIKRK